MPVQPPWTLDIETIVGVAIALLAMLVVQVGFPALQAAAAHGRSVEPVANCPVPATAHDEPDAS